MNTTGIEVIRPADTRYDTARKGWNLLHQHTPAEIWFPRTAEAAAACLQDVLSRGAAFRIRSGGHDINGYSSIDDGVVIDLRHLNSIEISDDSASATVAPGVRFRQLYPTLAQRKLVVPAGICDDVAVGGHALGGGNGYLHRFLGASCDQVIGLRMIDADGSVIRATAEENPDLFWALRGAGNANFGLVLEYTYRTTYVDKLSSFARSYSWDEYDEIFDSWQHWAPFADNRLTSTLTISKRGISVMGMFAGPLGDLTAQLPAFVHGAGSQPTAALDEYDGYDNALAGLMSYYVEGDDAVAQDNANFATAAVMSDLQSSDTTTAFKDAILNSPATSSVVFFARGGQICDVPAGFNAYRYRSQLLEPMIRTTWAHDGDRDACLAWVAATYNTLKPNFQGVYKNWASSFVETNPYQWYGDDLPRLINIKRQYDPHNAFHNPASLPTQVTEQQCLDWELPPRVVNMLRQHDSLIGPGTMST